MTILEIQTALNRQGFNPGDVDGVWGRRTMLAVKAFQQARGLKPDGVVGPLTLRALTGSTGATATGDGEVAPLVWYEEALNLVGTKEDKTVRSNPEILKWAKDLDIDYKDDDIPWCGLFVAHCVGATLPDEQLPVQPLLARSWMKLGEQCQPMRGAVLVFWRGSRSGSLGHVGFYHSEDAESYHVLGGNQSDSVSLTRVGKSRLLGARWPTTAAILTGTIVVAEGKGPLSHSGAET